MRNDCRCHCVCIGLDRRLTIRDICGVGVKSGYRSLVEFTQLDGCCYTAQKYGYLEIGEDLRYLDLVLIGYVGGIWLLNLRSNVPDLQS